MKEIHKIYLSQFFSGFAMIASFTPLYFLSNGITQSQLGFLLAANILTLSLFDIPTGAIADLFGHKISVFLGTLIWSLSYLLLYIAKGFPIFLLSMIIGGIGLALVSGALTSLIYDILDKQGNRKDFQKVYGTGNGMFLVGSVISASIGGFIYQYQASLIFLVAFLFTFMGAMSILFVKWNFVGDKPTIATYMKKMKVGFFLTINNQSLLTLVVMSIGFTFGIYVINNIKQPLLVATGYSIPQIGFITALISGLSALLYIYGHRILKRSGEFKILVIIGLVGVVSLILISFSSAIIALVCLILYQLIPSLRDPAITQLQQRHIADEQRATANSTMSFMTRSIIAVSLPFWGMVIDHFGINSSLIYLALLTSIISFVGLFYYRKSLDTQNS